MKFKDIQMNKVFCLFFQLSPFVFVNSEVYKFTEETTSHVGVISYFLTGRNNTDIKTGTIHPP